MRQEVDSRDEVIVLYDGSWCFVFARNAGAADIGDLLKTTWLDLTRLSVPEQLIHWKKLVSDTTYVMCWRGLTRPRPGRTSSLGPTRRTSARHRHVETAHWSGRRSVVERPSNFTAPWRQPLSASGPGVDASRRHEVGPHPLTARLITNFTACPDYCIRLGTFV